MPAARRLPLAGLALATVAFADGCSRADRPPLGTVSGVVTLDGQPLADATVFFTPDGRGRTSIGTTGPDGRYRLAYLRDIAGANPGRHTVRITTAGEAGGPERLPNRYHARTVLEATVRNGTNTCDFALTSAVR